MTIALPIIFSIIGFILLLKGSEYLILGSSNIAKSLNIPEIVIGLTIVSIGTSLPEMGITITSLAKGYADISIGNILGSSICNLLLILGVSSIISHINLKKETRIIEILLSLFLIVLYAIFCNTGNIISKYESIILIILFVFFLIYTIVMAKIGKKFDEENKEDVKASEEEKSNSFFKNIIYILIGIICLKFGGDFIIDNAVILAKYFKLTEKVISLTILSLGTSLPELVTSAVAARKGNSDISIGNIIGSNIFNLTLITGVSGLIKPIIFNLEYNLEILILIYGSILLFAFTLIHPKDKITRGRGIIFLNLYLAYMLIMLIKL